MQLTASPEVIEAARQGGQAEIEALLEAVWPNAYSVARGITLHSQAAQDAAQDACVAMYRNIASLRDAGAFRAWFYRIVTREALKHKKALNTTDPIDSDVAYHDDRTDTIDLMRGLARLSDAQRAAVVLHYFHGLSTPEIARALKVPDPTIRFRIMTARRRLRTLLANIEPSTKGHELYAI